MQNLILLAIIIAIGYYLIWPTAVWAFATIAGVLTFLAVKILWGVGIIAVLWFLFSLFA